MQGLGRSWMAVLPRAARHILVLGDVATGLHSDGLRVDHATTLRHRWVLNGSYARRNRILFSRGRNVAAKAVLSLLRAKKLMVGHRGYPCCV